MAERPGFGQIRVAGWRRRALVPLLTILGGVPPATAARPPAVEGVRTAEQIRIDARFDEAAWRTALVVDDFVQQLPQEGVPPTEGTVVRLLYDDEALYLGITCFDTHPDAILVTSLRRDDFAQARGEQLAFAIDSTDSGRDGFWFSVNAAGAQTDAQVFDEGRVFDTNWDGIWESAAQVTPEGWTAEVRLPYFNLRFDDAPENVMRINFFRGLRHKNEESYAPFIPRNYKGTMSFSLGRPLILRGIRRGPGLQVKPYGLGQASRHGGEEPERGDTDLTGDAGIDVKWGITTGFTADFTVRPDFAQVEADQQQVNLTRFPLFFPEKREFFLENAGLFDFGAPQKVQAFFSRRIGLDDAGQPVPLAGGARLTGRTGPWSIGALEVLSDASEGEPRTSFAVARVRRDLGARSTVGAILTDREATGEGGGNRVLGGDTLLVFGEDVYVEAYAMGSRTSGSGGDGYAGRVRASTTADLWRWEAEAGLTDEGLTPGIGFVRRNGVQWTEGRLAYRPRPEGLPAVRQFEFGGSAGYQEARTSDASLDGRVLDREGSLFHATEFESGDKLNASFEARFERLTEAFEIREGIVIPPGDYDQDLASVEAATWESRRVSGGVRGGYGAFYDGRLTTFGARLRVRVNAHATIETEWTENWVRLPVGDFDTRLAIARVNYGFTSRLFGSALVQWNDETDDLDLNLRVDFIHHPGADLFLVYNEARNTPRAPGEPATRLREGIAKLTWMFQF